MNAEHSKLANSIVDEIEHYLAGSEFQINHIQETAVRPEGESDEILKVRVYIEPDNDEMFEKLKDVVEFINSSQVGSHLEGNVGAGTVSSQKSYLHVIHPIEEYDRSEFKM